MNRLRQSLPEDGRLSDISGRRIDTDTGQTGRLRCFFLVGCDDFLHVGGLQTQTVFRTQAEEFVEGKRISLLGTSRNRLSYKQ